MNGFSSRSWHADALDSARESFFNFSPGCCDMTSKIFFRVANESEHDAVLEFLRQHFFTEEPINNAYPIKDDSKEEEFILSLLPDGNVVFAVDSTSGQIAGLASFGEITKRYPQESWDESETTTNRKWRDILKFMSYIESKSNVCERFGVAQSLHLHGVTVDKAYRGQGIGKLLFEESFRIAKSRNYRLVSAECSSVYSARIAQAAGMEHVSTVTYDEYHAKLGDKVFKPTPPNTEIKSFVRKI